jgi:Ca2+-binding RTX toxin-like protein
MRLILFSCVERLTGSARNDTLDAQEGPGNDTADGGTGTDTCQTDPGDRSLNCP